MQEPCPTPAPAESLSPETHKAPSEFQSIDECWVCKSHQLRRVQEDGFDLSGFTERDPELHRTYTGRTFWLVRCQECGFMQPEVLPSLPNYFDRIYDNPWAGAWMDQEFHGGNKDFIFNDVLRSLEKRLGSAQRDLLDVGAHVGRLVHLARQRGWDAEGIELNPRTSAYARDVAHLPVRHLSAQSLVAQGRAYSSVTLIDVLEHIPQPVAVLNGLKALLKPGGWIAIKVPFGRNQLRKERLRSRLRSGYGVHVARNFVHVNHFTPASLRRALNAAGFQNVLVGIGAPEGGALHYRVAYRLAKLLVGGVHTPLAMNLQAYAQLP